MASPWGWELKSMAWKWQGLYFRSVPREGGHSLGIAAVAVHGLEAGEAGGAASPCPSV